MSQQYFHLGFYSLLLIIQEITAQLLFLRNIKRYKVLIRENLIILIKRKKLSNTLHIAPDGEFIFWELIILKIWNRALQIWENILCIHKPDNRAAKLIPKFVDSRKHMLIDVHNSNVKHIYCLSTINIAIFSQVSRSSSKFLRQFSN